MRFTYILYSRITDYMETHPYVDAELRDTRSVTCHRRRLGLADVQEEHYASAVIQSLSPDIRRRRKITKRYHTKVKHLLALLHKQVSK